MIYPSKLIETAVEEISRLPGIGKKTALRLALHILKQPESYAASLSESLISLRLRTTKCTKCHSICDGEVCNICASHSRDRSILCVVEDTRDVMAIENTHQYRGLYHVLGGVISPLEGIGPGELNIESLLARAKNEEVREIILAINPTPDGDMTNFYLSKRLRELNKTVTTIARGIPLGSELEYIDEMTLGRSIASRITSQ